MNERHLESPMTASLREWVEKLFRERPAASLENLDALSTETLRTIVHELRVYQIELEMQNGELRAAEADLDASRARYFDRYDLAPVGDVTISEKGLILEANLTAAIQLGSNRGKMVKRTFTRWILQEDADKFSLLHKRLIRTSEPQKCELRLRKSDGTSIWSRIEGTAILADSGKTVSRISFIDITGLKRAEAVVLQNLARAEEFTRLKSRFVSMASHELRTPLANIMLDCDLLKNFGGAMTAERSQSVLAGLMA